MRRVVIAGATGAIGTALIDKMINENIETVILVRPDSSRKESIRKHPLVKIIECGLKEYEIYAEALGVKKEPNEAVINATDVMDKAQASLAENSKMMQVNSDTLNLMRTIIPCDVFFHFAWSGTSGAARNDVFLQNDNVKYTLHACTLAKALNCNTFIGAGSQAEYGRCNEKLTASTKAMPENGYGMAKLCAGQLSRLYCDKLAIKHIWVRILSVYGPADGDGSMVSSVIDTALRGENPKLTPGGQQWDYLYSKDAAEAFYRIAIYGKDKKIYVLGSGKSCELKQYVYTLCAAINPEIKPQLGAVPYSDNQVMYLCADINELTEDTGFIPAYDFEKGIGETIDSRRKRLENGL